MAATSAIEWTEATWNPILGCDRVSPGCDRCYAITQARIRGGNPHPAVAEAFAGLTERRDGQLDWTGRINLLPERLTQPLKWKKPKRIFVNSLSDLFHKDVPDEYIARVFAVMAATPRHTFQVLTKRPARMRSLLSSDEFRLLAKDAHGEMLLSGLLKGQAGPVVINAFPPKNVWLGVSVESQKWADIRIPALLDTPAAVRWLSCEPLLGPVDVSFWFEDDDADCTCTRYVVDYSDPERFHPDNMDREDTPSCPAHHPLHWVVVGGESGHGARPMHPDWARSLRDQCTAAGVPFYFKQWGEWGPAPWKVPVCDPAVGWTGTDEELAAAKAAAEATGATHAYASWAHEYGHELYQPPHKPWSVERDDHLDGPHAPMRRWGKKHAGRELDGRTWDQYPVLSSTAVRRVPGGTA